jgi:hypothetical protein
MRDVVFTLLILAGGWYAYKKIYGVNEKAGGTGDTRPAVSGDVTSFPQGQSSQGGLEDQLRFAIMSGQA